MRLTTQVTGSLNCAVAQWLIGRGIVSAPYTARQGSSIGFDGRISIVQDDDGTVWCGGATRTIIRGETVDL